MELIREWIINWFIENSDIEKQELEENISQNYMALKYIDSFGFINFVSDIEEHFDITFENEQFQDRQFSTIDGLSKIIFDIKQ